MSSRAFLPVFGPGNIYLYDAPLSTVDRLIDQGKVKAVGTRHRVRKLLALCGSEELLIAAKPPTGQRWSHKAETDDNPRNVWTHAKKLLWQ